MQELSHCGEPPTTSTMYFKKEKRYPFVYRITYVNGFFYCSNINLGTKGEKEKMNAPAIFN